MQQAPRDVADVQQQYDRYITHCIQRLSRRPVSREDLDDLKQQVLLRILDQHCLEIYNPHRARFTTYLYYIIRTVVCNRYRLNDLDPLMHTVATDWADPDPTLRETFHDLTSQRQQRSKVAEDFNGRFEAYLETVPLRRPCYRGMVTLPNGDERPHGFALVFHLLRQEYTPSEIAVVMGMTPSNVCYYTKRIYKEARLFLRTTECKASAFV